MWQKVLMHSFWPSYQYQIRRFFITPKGLLLPILLLLAIVGTPGIGIRLASIDIFAAVFTAICVDVGLLWLLKREVHFPSGALITGFIIALVLSPQMPWYIPVLTAILAITSKHGLKIGRRPIFNPAAIGLLGANVLLQSGQNWWGAVSTLSPWWILLLLVVGFLITDRVNKFPQVLVFMGSYFLLFSMIAFMGGARQVGEIFQVPFVNAVLFFAFFMLTDPPTSPGPYEDQMVFGLVVSITSLLAYVLFHDLSFLLVALLIGNGLVAWERRPARAGLGEIVEKSR